ncbi:hypothetical protein NEF87_000907 [Candidatus Lokiarchaeum ossiferum]|uniref:EamA domain-containing protein n=1 Tax=Candidatus Lokiarchaeum ossiferum TaxID=2951803 RepID=A0ABY6HP00_9ARCH|nr:hypothetical protein NEF87_000907 [Candidatus Lokiarchaeum sp. B-35]
MNGILSAFLMVITFALSFILIRKVEQTYSTVFINFIRAIIGLSCFALYTLFIGQIHHIFDLNFLIWGILGASIIFGVVIGDTAFFKCQKFIGPTNAATFAITSPIFTMILAILILGDSFQWILLLSSIITGAGVYLLVHLQQNSDEEQEAKTTDNLSETEMNKLRLISGSLFGLLASLAWSFANIYSEMGLGLSENELQIDSNIYVVTNIIRYLVASTCMGSWWMINRSKKKKNSVDFHNNESPDSSRKLMSILILSAILGTFLGEIFFGITIVKMGSTFIAIMGSSLPVFTIPLNYIINKEKLNIKSLPGIVITLGGVFILIFASS